MKHLHDWTDEELQFVAKQFAMLPNSGMTSYAYVPDWIWNEFMRRQHTEATQSKSQSRNE